MNTGIDSDTTYGVMQTRNLGLGKVAAYYYQSTATLNGGDFSTSPADSGAAKTITLNSLTSTAGRYYGVEADKEGRLFVNVPWESGGGAVDSEKVKVSKVEHREESTRYYKIGLISPGNEGKGGDLAVTTAEMAYLPEIEISSAGYMLGSSLKLSNSLFVGGDSSGSAYMLDGTNRVLMCDGDVKINNGYYLKLNKISAPTSSNGTTYGYGSSGQVLKSNGTTVYWASDSTGTDNDKKTSSGNTSSKIFLVGATSQSSSGLTTYSHDTAYVGTDGRVYSDSKPTITGATDGSSIPYKIVTITQAKYNALSTKDANTLYVII